MVPKLFIDIDVILDFFTNRANHGVHAKRLFQLNEEGKIQMYVSAASINNIYYLCRKARGHKVAIDIIEELLVMTDIISTTKDDILRALRSHFKDFEDSIQNACALKVENMEAILTRNVRDYKSSGLAIFTPEQYLLMRESS